MKKILLPTDFSDNAYNAVQYALLLFKNETCVFYILHSYTPAIYQAEYILHSPGQIGLGDIYQVNVMEQLQKLQHRIETDFQNPKHTFKLRAAFNTLVEEISETTAEEKIDLIVMGTQGATGAMDIILGTNTVNVIRKTNCPVIAVPSDFKYLEPKAILFPTDYEVNYTSKHLKALINLVEEHDSTLHVLHITSPDGLSATQLDNKAKLLRMLGTVNRFFHDEADQDIISGINTFRSANKINVVVMIQNKHTFLERLFIEPIIKKIVFNLDIPLMVLPAIE